MPKYLGIDFLTQALRQKDHLLSRMLIRFPEYAEDEAIFAISSKTERNFPWFKAPFEDVPKKDAATYFLESIPSEFGRKPERLQSSRVIEYIPSSNPDSPPPSFLSDSYFDLEEEIVRDVCDYLSRHEVDISKYDSPYNPNAEWQLEEIVMKDCFALFLRRIPRFQDLASRLKPRKVADPFVGNNGCLRCEFQIICSRFYCEKDIMNISNVGTPSKECFVKQRETECLKIASPIDPAYDWCDSHVKIHHEPLRSMSIEESSEMILESDTNVNEIKNFCITGTPPKHQAYSSLVKIHPKPAEIFFLEINQTETNHEVKDVSSLVLESPNNDTKHEDVDLNGQDTDHLEPCQLRQGELLRTLSPHSQKKIVQEAVDSCRLTDKMSSAMLVVPDVDNNEPVKQDLTSKLSTLLQEDFQSQLELQLHWDPLHRKPQENITQLRFTMKCKEHESPMKLPDLPVGMTAKLKKISWKNIYMTNTDASPLVFDLTKEEKPSQLVPCVAEKQNQNFPEANTYITNPTRSKSPGQTIIRNTTKFGSAKTPAIVSNGSKKYNIHSAIDDFVLLRTGINSSSSCPRKAIVKAMKIGSEIAEKNNHDICFKVEDLKEIAEVVEVPLADELQTAHNYVENNIKYFLVQLQETGCVASSYTSDNLTGDYTRFVLKQEEKKKSDLFNKDQSYNDKKYKMLICLHTLVTTAELIRECGVTVAQDYIKTMSTQYNEDLGGSLDQIKDYLVKAERILINTRTFHPKVAATYKYVRTWQLQPPSIVFGGKILVMVFRGFQDISKSLMSHLQLIKGLRTITIERESSLFPLLNDAHVVICDPTNIPDNFPWSLFALFISYENKTEWLSKVLFGKPIKAKRFIYLKCISSQDQQNVSECNVDNIEDRPTPDPWPPNREIYTLIGSSKIAKNTDLLRCLEQKCGIVIIEREYEKILKNTATTSSKMCRQPDLLLDQCASVIIENVINFGDEEGYKVIVDQVLSTSFKCQICTIILVCKDKKHAKYSFVGEVQSNLAKFHGCLLSIQQSFPNFVVDIFYSQSVKDTASLVRRICETTRDSSHVFTKQDWARRNWLAEECSKDERFLLGFPSLNSFSAQLMLNVLPLTTLLTTPFESLKKALPWIPESILKNFKETTDCGLHVEDDESYPIQIPQFPDDHIVDESEYSNYHFNPVIQNCDEDAYDCTFQRLKIPLNNSQQFEKGIFIPPTSSFGDIRHKTSKKNFLQCDQPISNDHFGKSENFTQIDLDDSSNYETLQQAERQNQVLSVVSVQKSYFSTVPNDGRKPKSKSLLRPSKNFKRSYEMPEAVGVVQPKPRNIPDMRPKSVSSVTQPAVSHNYDGPRYPGTILPNPRYSRQTSSVQEFWHENPQKKKKKLTLEIVPGAKNGQTRLAFI